jgi:hypothetical protein
MESPAWPDVNISALPGIVFGIDSIFLIVVNLQPATRLPGWDCSLAFKTMFPRCRFDECREEKSAGGVRLLSRKTAELGRQREALDPVDTDALPPKDAGASGSRSRAGVWERSSEVRNSEKNPQPPFLAPAWRGKSLPRRNRPPAGSFPRSSVGTPSGRSSVPVFVMLRLHSPNKSKTNANLIAVNLQPATRLPA